jgi:hypothetical protein
MEDIMSNPASVFTPPLPYIYDGLTAVDYNNYYKIRNDLIHKCELFLKEYSLSKEEIYNFCALSGIEDMQFVLNMTNIDRIILLKEFIQSFKFLTGSQQMANQMQQGWSAQAQQISVQNIQQNAVQNSQQNYAGGLQSNTTIKLFP